MIHDQALIPQILSARGNRTLENIFSVILGFALMSALAQITIRLPWTPVPVTGQTFGVYLVALAWGRKRGLAVLATYLAVGMVGLPVFAVGASSASVGYLVGMAIASYWIGWLADKGWTKSFWRCYLAGASGSIIIFTSGLIGLSFFVPRDQLFVAGVLPFLPGDALKTALASLIVSRLRV